MSAGEDGKWRVHGPEIDAMKTLYAIGYGLSADPKTLPMLASRIEATDGVGEKLSQAGGLVVDAVQRLIETFPEHQKQSLVRQLIHSEMRVTIPQAVSVPGCFVIKLEDLVQLVDAAMATECCFCEKTEVQARKCKLRKTLDAISTHDAPRIAGCSYRKYAVDMRVTPWERPGEGKHEGF